jgi:uncharacterized protein YegP (UPF0339 family)
MYTHIEVTKGKRRWYWRVVAENGQIILTSEKYYSKWNAKRAAKRLGEINRLLVKVV